MEKFNSLIKEIESLHFDACKKIHPKKDEFLETIRKEIDIFVDEIVNQGDMEACPFFKEVWCGDAYSFKKLKGLEALRDELKEF